MDGSVDPARSALMSRIRGKDTAPETILRKALWAAGLRYRKHARAPIGRPDVVFKGKRVAVFIDGCFWHGCPDHYVHPRSKRDFWANKLADNVARDRRQTLALEAAGWKVVRAWEHEIFESLDRVVADVRAALDGHAPARRAWRVVRVEELDRATDLERRHEVDLRVAECVQVVQRYRTTARGKRPAGLYPRAPVKRGSRGTRRGDGPPCSRGS